MSKKKKPSKTAQRAKQRANKKTDKQPKSRRANKKTDKQPKSQPSEKPAKDAKKNAEEFRQAWQDEIGMELQKDESSMEDDGTN